MSKRPEGTEEVAPGRGAKRVPRRERRCPGRAGQPDRGHRRQRVLPGSPRLRVGRCRAAPESTAACAAITQDKLGQSRAIYPLLEDLPWPNPPTGLQGEVDRARRYSVSFLDDPLPSWTNVVAALALVGPAVNTVLEAVEHSRYEALAGGRTASSTRRGSPLHTPRAWYARSPTRSVAATSSRSASTSSSRDALLVRP